MKDEILEQMVHENSDKELQKILREARKILVDGSLMNRAHVNATMKVIRLIERELKSRDREERRKP